MLAFTGCYKSWKAYEIYLKNELKNMRLIKFICWCMLFVEIWLFGITGLLPVLYLSFGFPLPEDWMTPLPTK